MRTAPPSAYALLLALHAAPSADARSTYVAKIPNGAKVSGIKAIGHVAGTTGGGPRNAFGVAFQDAAYQWTAALCAADSDGDGQTNGQELGDPCCQWAVATNEKVLWTTGVSHPGDASMTAAASLWASIDCSASSTTASMTATSSTNTTSTTTSTTTNTTTNSSTATNSTNGAAGPLPSVVGMGVTALLFAVTAALAVA